MKYRLMREYDAIKGQSLYFIEVDEGYNQPHPNAGWKIIPESVSHEKSLVYDMLDRIEKAKGHIMLDVIREYERK